MIDEDKQFEAQDMLLVGKSVKEVVKKTGICQATVYRIRKRGVVIRLHPKPKPKPVYCGRCKKELKLT